MLLFSLSEKSFLFLLKLKQGVFILVFDLKGEAFNLFFLFLLLFSPTLKFKIEFFFVMLSSNIFEVWVKNFDSASNSLILSKIIFSYKLSFLLLYLFIILSGEHIIFMFLFIFVYFGLFTSIVFASFDIRALLSLILFKVLILFCWLFLLFVVTFSFPLSFSFKILFLIILSIENGFFLFLTLNKLFFPLFL